MIRRTVTADHEASYPDPISIKQGDVLELSGEEYDWDGHLWLWAINTQGKTGWIPDTLASHTADGCFAKKDYSAKELTCVTGQVLESFDTTHGWAWCRSQDGNEGWVPLKNLS